MKYKLDPVRIFRVCLIKYMVHVQNNVHVVLYTVYHCISLIPSFYRLQYEGKKPGNEATTAWLSLSPGFHTSA